MIEARQLGKRFGGRAAIEDVSFTVARGEVVGFLGPNGAGKTTTMRILTGFLPPSAGTVTVDGLDVLTDSLAVRQRIGYLPESVPLYREHRVQEMLWFQGRLRGLSRSESRRRAGAVLERVGMSDRARSLIGRLSKGQRQRVGLAVALLPEPDVLVLDEPTSGLDPLQRLEVRRLIGELARERTVLLSSHILPEIEAVCPRVIILHRGRIAADGTQAKLVEELGEGYVRLEVEAGANDGVAAGLGALPGVSAVVSRGHSGAFESFEVRGAGELCEPIGRLCREHGWVVRELSTQHATLERLFARIAFELEPERAAPEGGG